MTIASDANDVQYTGDGATLVFSFPYKFFADADLKVIKKTIATGVEQVLALTTDYTVEGEGLAAGGTVTLLVAPTSSFYIIIRRNLTPSQPHDLRNQGSLSPATIEMALDRQSMSLADAQLRDEVEFAAVRAEVAAAVALVRSDFALSPAVDINNSTVTATGSTTARALNTRFAQIFNVHNYGAVGDGTTNDAVAIQAAMTAAKAAGGGIVEFQNKNYKINALLTLDAGHGVILRGQGYNTIITSLAGIANAVKFTNSNRVGIEGMRFTGNVGEVILLDVVTESFVRNCWIAGGGAGGGAGLYGSAGVFLHDVADIIIENNLFSGNGLATLTGSADIGSRNNDGSTVERVIIKNNKCVSTTVQRNIVLYNPQYCSIEGNYCSGAECDSTTSTAGGHGIELTRTTAGVTYGDNIVRGNRIKTVQGCGIRLDNQPRSIVANNRIEDSCVSLNEATTYEAAITLVRGSRAVVAGNLIRTSGKGGISFQGSYTQVIGNHIESCVQNGILIDNTNGDDLDGGFTYGVQYCPIVGNVIADVFHGITDNKFFDTGVGRTQFVRITSNSISASRASGKGIGLDNFVHGVIAHNVIDKMSLHGMHLKSCQHTPVIGNVCRQNSVASANVSSGIYLEGVTASTVAHNKCHNTDATGQKNGIEVAAGSGVNGLHIIDNHLFTNQTLGLGGDPAERAAGNVITSGLQQGTVTLVAGVATVNTTAARTASRIRLTRYTAAGTLGHLSVSISNGVSFSIVNSSATETSTVFWEIIN